MKRVRVNLLVITALLISVLFTYSCTDSLNPIFYTLENEEQVVDTSLDNSLTVHSLLRDGANYYTAAGSIFYRPATEDSTTWNKVVSSGVSDASGTTMLCNKLVAFSVNGKYYGSFVSQDGFAQGLYSADSLGANTAWAEVTNTSIKGKQITNLMVVNNIMLVVVREISNPNSYNMYYSADGTNFLEAPALSDVLVPIIDAAYDTASSEYWVITENKIFKGSDLGSLSEISYSEPLAVPVEGLGGIFYSADFSILFISTKNGIIYSSNDNGATWMQVGDPVKVSDASVPFGGFAQIDSSTIFAATKGYGFYKIADNGTTTTISRFSNSTISGLYNAVINSFYLDDSSTGSKTVFICTSGFGLWSNKLPLPSDDTGWKWE